LSHSDTVESAIERSSAISAAVMRSFLSARSASTRSGAVLWGIWCGAEE
jgi:hypothetical protein